MPAKGYTWKTTGNLNRKIRDEYSDLALPVVLNMLSDSYLLLRKLIENHTDEALFEKKRYPWTGSTSLGAYLISATSSHDDWHLN